MTVSRKPVLLSLGFLTTLLVMAGWLWGIGRQLEWWSLDWRFRRAVCGNFRDDLVHVEIDDLSIEQLGRWPWPRQQIAGMVDTLTSAGAESIALDVLFPEPQPIRYVSQAQSIYGAFEQVLHEGSPQAVMDDAVLAQSIRDAGNVGLAMHGQFDRIVSSPYEEDIKERLRANPDTSFRRLAQSITGIDPQSPSADETEDQFQKAYLRVRSKITLEKFARGALDAPRAQTVAPLHTLLQYARDAGFVTIEPDEDGILRRTRLLGKDGEHTYTQLSLSLALHRLEKDTHKPVTLRQQGDQVLIYAGEERIRRIDLQAESMLINWSLRTAGQTDPRHRRIPARAVVKVWMEKQRLASLDRLQFALKVKWISVGEHIADPNTQALYWTFMDETKRLDEAYTQRVKMQQQDYFSRLYDPCLPSLAPEVRVIEGQERQTEKRLFELADSLFAGLSRDRDAFLARPPDVPGAGESAEFKKYQQRARQADEIQSVLEQIPRDRAGLVDNIAKLQQELGERIAGKICLIGSSATAAADFVPTPLGTRTPGVNVLAQIYDTIVSGELIRPAGGGVNAAAIFASGMMVTVLAVRLNAAVCGALVILLAVLYTAINTFVILPRWHYHLVMAYPLGAMLMVFVILTVYKELTEERAKRQIRHMFSRALSSSLVDELMRDPQLANLGGQQRELSCLFSDLAGFTPLSQSLGPQKTVKLLNQYFDCVTEVVQTRFGGYINKFLGDGIFALFGAPVTQPDHARRAVLSAVEYIHAIHKFNQEISSSEVNVRIGITTGQAMVGNCGSTTRMDYTAIGDCVNLASRLESASKYFRTHILIEAETWKQSHLEHELLVRSLGLVQITGVAQPVWIFHVAGYLHQHRDLVESYTLFSRGIEVLYNKRYAEAVEIFQQIQNDLAGDFPASVFLAMARKGTLGEHPQAHGASSPEFSGGVVRIVPPWELP